MWNHDSHIYIKWIHVKYLPEFIKWLTVRCCTSSKESCKYHTHITRNVKINLHIATKLVFAINNCINTGHIHSHFYGKELFALLSVSCNIQSYTIAQRQQLKAWIIQKDALDRTLRNLYCQFQSPPHFFLTLLSRMNEDYSFISLQVRLCPKSVHHKCIFKIWNLF